MSNTRICSQETIFSTQKILPDYRKVLYIEDHPANLALVGNLLARRLDWKLLTARDGNLGITIARTNQPDVILMDINLPGISGFEALEILLADPEIAHIPVIALSSDAFPHQIEKGIKAGFFRYLTKPYKLDDLMGALDDSIYFSLNNCGYSATNLGEEATVLT
ncbi:response regulator [Undibacterium sp. TC4M20W]|uniref:response regulator n=1 Tax=Undibacterium sp. TC4M20W TaxID=3413052 RepID=UPI003BF3D371